MYFEHVYDQTLAQGSYLVGCQVTGEAIVIDAKRDIDTYLEIAEANNLNITHLTETHIHADYLAGTREIAAVTGAKMYLSAEGGEGWEYEFDHEPLKDGDVIKVGNLTLEVMHTPGHTPESISFLLRDHPASDEPVMVFTGDFVFVGDIGRPDLLEEAAGLIGTADAGAHQMWDSLEKFAALPDHVQVWSAHGAGSACGKALGAVPSSTVGYEKIRNWAFQYGEDKQGFMDYLLEDQPEAPKYFAMMKKLNKVDRPLLVEVPQHPMLSKEDFLAFYNKGLKVIDARDKEDYAKGYLPGTINIKGSNSFSNWMGWLLNYNEQFVIIANPEEREDLTRKLMRIGMDNIYGFFAIDELENLGVELEKAELLDLDAFKTYVGKDDVQIVDVRGKAEYNEAYIEGTSNVFVGTIEENLDQIDKNKKVIIHCQGGDRATIAYSLLKKHGYENVASFLGGVNAWMGTNEPTCSR